MNTLKTLYTTLRRIALWFAMRSVETHIDGINTCMPLVRDPMTLGRMEAQRHFARVELARIRAEYNATFKPGKRNVWSAA